MVGDQTKIDLLHEHIYESPAFKITVSNRKENPN